jgi:hypothetical protein
MKKKDIEKHLERDDLLIEGNTATWHIVEPGLIQGLYTGTFRFKCFPTPSERLASGRVFRELLGSHATQALKYEEDLAFALAQLKYRVLEGPPFWNSSLNISGIAGDIPDVEVLFVIFEAAMSSENKYLAQLEKRKIEAVKNAKLAAEALLAKKVVKEQIEEDDDE